MNLLRGRFLILASALLLLSACASDIYVQTTDTAPATTDTTTTTTAPVPERMPPVELVAIEVDCSSFTKPHLMDRELTADEVEWAEEIGPMMGWSFDEALPRTRFEEFMQGPALSPLYESPRYAGAIIGPIADYLGYAILVGGDPPSPEMAEALCQLPELQIRVGATSSASEISNAMDKLHDYPDADGLIVGSSSDTRANGIDLRVTDVDAGVDFALQLELDTGVRVLNVTFREATRFERMTIDITTTARQQGDSNNLQIVAGGCGGSPEATVVEYHDRVEVEIMATVQLPPGGEPLCGAGRAIVELDEPLGDRELIDTFDGQPIEVIAH